MKALKITLLLALLVTVFSCTKQDLNEDDVLEDTTEETTFTGGGVND